MNKIFRFLLIIVLNFFLLSSSGISEEGKLKIGLLIPLTGENAELGKQIIKAVKIALKDISSEKIEIYPRDTGSNPSKTIKSALELKDIGVKIVIGPVFYKSLSYLDEIDNIIFVSLTNKNLNLPDNVISAGVNATSQLNTIKKFIKLNDIKKTIFLTPKLDYEIEIKKAIKQSNVKVYKHFIYDTEPTKLTAQIEKITNYKVRKQNLLDEIRLVDSASQESLKEYLRWDEEGWDWSFYGWLLNALSFS